MPDKPNMIVRFFMKTCLGFIGLMRRMDEAIKRTQKRLKEFYEKEINKIKYNILKELIDKNTVLPEKEMDMDKIKKLANKVVSQMNND